MKSKNLLATSMQLPTSQVKNYLRLLRLKTQMLHLSLQEKKQDLKLPL